MLGSFGACRGSVSLQVLFGVLALLSSDLGKVLLANLALLEVGSELAGGSGYLALKAVAYESSRGIGDSDEEIGRSLTVLGSETETRQ